MKRALVTGGAGFVGANLALELERRSVEVVVLDDFSSGSFENLKGFEGDVVAGDVSRPEQWADRIGQVDVIFHEGAITDTTVTDQRRMMDVNVEGFRNILELAVKRGIERVVYASSAAVYGSGPCPMKEDQLAEPMNVYGFSKKVMESVAWSVERKIPALRVVGLRYFNVYGPREAAKAKLASMIWQLYGQMREGRRPRIFKHGEQFRDFIYVKDVVEANLRAAEAQASGVYNVCTGKPATFNRVIEVLNEVLQTRHKPEYFDNPYGFYQNQTQGDPSAARTGLKFESRFSIEDGIRDYFGRKGIPAGR